MDFEKSTTWQEIPAKLKSWREIQKNQVPGNKSLRYPNLTKNLIRMKISASNPTEGQFLARNLTKLEFCRKFPENKRFWNKTFKKQEPGTKFKWNVDLGKNCNWKSNSWEENQKSSISHRQIPGNMRFWHKIFEKTEIPARYPSVIHNLARPPQKRSKTLSRSPGKINI